VELFELHVYEHEICTPIQGRLSKSKISKSLGCFFVLEFWGWGCYLFFFFVSVMQCAAGTKNEALRWDWSHNGSKPKLSVEEQQLKPC